MLKHRDERILGALHGFSHINRYWDKQNHISAAKILPGEYYVTKNNEMIATVLGSCISACIRDRKRGIGGMNHFMLPISRNVSDRYKATDTSDETRYGNYAMEHMINDILKHGGKREDLEVKICGGGRVLKNMNNMDVGKKNIDFVKDYIETEHLLLVSDDTGGEYPRKVQYYPATGRLRIKKLVRLNNETIFIREKEYKSKLEHEPVSGEIELF